MVYRIFGRAGKSETVTSQEGKILNSYPWWARTLQSTLQGWWRNTVLWALSFSSLCHTSPCMPGKENPVRSPSLLALFQAQSFYKESDWPNVGFVPDSGKLSPCFYPGIQNSQRGKLHKFKEDIKDCWPQSTTNLLQFENVWYLAYNENTFTIFTTWYYEKKQKQIKLLLIYIHISSC